MGASRILTTDTPSPLLLVEVRHLLNEAFAGAFSDDDWAHALGGVHVLALDGTRPVAHASVVPRTLVVAGLPVRTGYVEAVATAPPHRNEGLGSRVMVAIGEEIGTRFAMGALSTDRHGFYGRLGWERWRGPTFVRDGASVRRTPDEDAGIMVLRTAASEALDTLAPISCEARSGDDW